MPVLQKQTTEAHVGLKISPSKRNPKEIQDIAYLLANGHISEKTALELYEGLLKAGTLKRSRLRRVLSALFPALLSL